MKVVLEKRLEQSLKAQIGLPVLSARPFGNFRKNDSDGTVRTGHCRCVPHADLEYRRGRTVLHGRLRRNLGAA